MKQLFYTILLLCFFATTGFSQAIVKGSGILYTNGAPTDTINVNYHSEVAIDTTTGYWYEFQRDSGLWVKAGYRVYHWENEGVPTFTPTDKQSNILINNGDSLFHYRSGTWNLISGGSGLVSNEISLSGNIITSDINGVYIDTTIVIGSNVLTFGSDSIKSSINGINSNAIYLGGYLDNTDDQKIDTFEISSNQLRISNESDGEQYKAVDLSPYLDNTDDQVLTITAGKGTIRLEDGGSVILNDSLTNNEGLLSVSESGGVGQIVSNTLGSNTIWLTGQGIVQITESGDTLYFNSVEVDGDSLNEIQVIDTFLISNDTIYLSLARDGQAVKYVVLPAGVVDTDNQTIDTFEIASNILRLSIEDDGEVFKTVDLSGYLDNTDSQQTDTFDINNNWLRLSLQNDGVILDSVNLAPYLDDTDTDDQTLSWNGGTGEITISEGNTIDIDGRYLQSEVDGSTTNEIQSLSITGTGGTIRLDLGGGSVVLNDSSATNEIQVIDTFSRSNDTIYLSLSQDGQAQKYVVLPTDIDTDNQQIDTFDINSNWLRISLQDDGVILDSVSLSAYLDNTDSQTLSYNPTTDEITISGGNTIDITEVDTDTDDQTLSWNGGTGEITISEGNTIDIDGRYLQSEVDGSTTNEIQEVDSLLIDNNFLKISLSNDGVIYDSVSLSSYLDNTDSQGFSGSDDGTTFTLDLSGTASDIAFKEGSGITITRSGTELTFAAAGGSGITSLNSQTGASQTFATGTSGTDFNISSGSDIHTFNIPDASASNRGLITTGDQTIGGEKTFNDTLKILNGVKLINNSATSTLPGLKIYNPNNDLMSSLYSNTTTGSTIWEIRQNKTAGYYGYMAIYDIDTSFEIKSNTNRTNFNSTKLRILTGGTERLAVSNSGLIAVTAGGTVVSNPTAKLHIAAQSTSANTAPIKFTSGSLMTTEEAGALEFNSDRLYFTKTTGPTRETIAYLSDITGLSDGDKGDITVSSSGTVWTIDNDVVTFAKFQNIASDRLIGRDAASSGDATEISVTGGIEFTGSDQIQTSAFTGDVTKSAGGTALTIANDAVTYAKIQNVGANSVLANNTGSSGDVAEVALAASELLGRGSTGNVAAITLGAGLSMSGTTLNVSGGSGITSLNGLTGATQTMVTATGGTDFNISSSGTTHTFNLPDHGSGVRGVINTGSQSIYGAKTFTSTATFAPGSGSSIVINSGGSIHGYTNGNLTGVILQNTAGDGAIHALANTSSDYSLYTIIEPGGVVGTDGLEMYHLGGGYTPAQLFSNQSIIFRGNASVTNGMRYILDASAPILFANGGYNTTNERMRIDSDGNIAISGGGTVITDATARLHIQAGGTTIAPLKFNSGSLLSTPEVGAFEFNSDRLYFTKTTGPTRETIAYLSDITGGVSDGDKGDITVSGSGTVWTVDNNAVSFSEIANGLVSDNDYLSCNRNADFMIGYFKNYPGGAITTSDRGIWFDDEVYIYANDSTNTITSRIYSQDGQWWIKTTKSPDETWLNVTKDKMELYANDGTDNSTIAVDSDSLFIQSNIININSNTSLRIKAGGSYGTAGQVLTKDATNTVSWATPAGGGASVIVPSTITSDQDNYNPTGFDGATDVLVSGNSGFRAITSMAAQSDGEQKIFTNVGDYPIYFPGSHPDGTAGNRIYASEDLVLMPNQSITFKYYSAGSNDGWYPIDFSSARGGKVMEWVFLPGSPTAGDNSNLTFVSSGTGAGTGAQAATSGLPGGIYCSTGTTASGKAHIYLNKTSVNYVTYGLGHTTGSSVISLSNLSNGTDSFIVNLCFMGTPSGNAPIPTGAAIGIRYSHSLNGGNWTGYTIDNGGSETTVDLGLAVAANALYAMSVEFDKSLSEARFYINGKMLGRSTANMPTSTTVAGLRVGIFKGVGTGVRSIYLHSISTRTVYP